MPVLTFSPKQGLYEKRHRQEQIVPEKPSQEQSTRILGTKQKG